MSAQRRALAGDRLAGRWTQLYTRRLNEATARDRRDELASDRFDHIAAAQAVGLSAGATSRAIAARMLLGVPADLSWRHQHLRAERQAGPKESAMTEQAARTRGRDGAIFAGLLVNGWVVLVAIASAVEAAQTDRPMYWPGIVLILVVATIGVVGLVRLVREAASGPFLLAGAAMGSTMWFFWFPIIPVVGFLVAAGFVAYGMSATKKSDPVSLEQVRG